MFSDQKLVLFMARGPDAFFYGFTGIKKPQVFDQSDRAYHLSYFKKVVKF